MAEPSTQATAPTIIVPASYEDPATGALYVHEDLLLRREDWKVEAHVSPPKAEERFGDVESWAAYVRQYAGAPDYMPLLTWNSLGLRAVLDYHLHLEEGGRCQWTASHPFEKSPAWYAWVKLADGNPVPQKRAIEALEDLAEDIVEPVPTELTNLLRSLRSTANATAQTEVRPDGTTKVSFSSDRTVKTPSDVELPGEFTIGIQVLKGHVNDQGAPVKYGMKVRVRASVGDDAHLALRFSLPAAERVLEDVFAERVRSAKALVGDEYSLLRAAG